MSEEDGQDSEIRLFFWKKFWNHKLLSIFTDLYWPKGFSAVFSRIAILWPMIYMHLNLIYLIVDT